MGREGRGQTSGILEINMEKLTLRTVFRDLGSGLTELVKLEIENQVAEAGTTSPSTVKASVLLTNDEACEVARQLVQLVNITKR